MRADLVVERDRLEDVEELALVFVDALDLDVEQRRRDRPRCRAGRAMRLASRALLARLTAAKRVLERGVVGEARRGRSSASISSRKRVADRLARSASVRPGLHCDQPAPRRDAVGLVVDAVGIERVQVGEHRLLHQLGVQRRDAVDRVRADEGEIAHAHAPAAVLVDQRDRRRICSSANWSAARASSSTLGVDRVDDLHVARQQPLEQRHRPALQRLGQQRVVGVAEGAAW